MTQSYVQKRLSSQPLKSRLTKIESSLCLPKRSLNITEWNAIENENKQEYSRILRVN